MDKITKIGFLINLIVLVILLALLILMLNLALYYNFLSIYEALVCLIFSLIVIAYAIGIFKRFYEIKKSRS